MYRCSEQGMTGWFFSPDSTDFNICNILKAIKGGSLKLSNHMQLSCLKIKNDNYQNLSRIKENIITCLW